MKYKKLLFGVARLEKYISVTIVLENVNESKDVFYKAFLLSKTNSKFKILEKILSEIFWENDFEMNGRFLSSQNYILDLGDLC